jgi:hypothetical protein
MAEKYLEDQVCFRICEIEGGSRIWYFVKRCRETASGKENLDSSGRFL